MSSPSTAPETAARPRFDFGGWFVRRAGLARVTTFACALGLALATIAGARPGVGMVGLVVAVLVVAGRLLLSLLERPAGGRLSPMLLVAVVLIGLFSGYLGGSIKVTASSRSLLQPHAGVSVRAELTVVGLVRSHAGWQSAVAIAREVALGSSESTGSASERVLLEIAPSERGNPAALAQGQIIAFKGTIRLPDGPSSSGFDQAAYLQKQGVHAVLRAHHDGIRVLGSRGGVSGWFDRLRASALDHLSRGPSPQLSEVLQGVVVGDTAGMDKDWQEAFRRAGTAHMFSVSGLHVASLAAIMMGLSGLLRAPRSVGFLLAAAAAVLLIPFVGASPPVVRAAVMIVVVLAGRWLGRGRDQWQVLALAAVVVLALDPLAVTDVGFQLSFAALAGMIAFLGPLQKAFGRLPDSLSSGLSVSIAATIGTAPVSMLVFGRISLVAPLANLLVVPVLPAITGLGMAAVFLGFLWGGLSALLDYAVSVPVAWIVLVSRMFAVAPVLGVQDLGRALLAIGAGAVVLPVALALSGREVRTPLGVALPFFKRALRRCRARAARTRRWARVAGVMFVLVAMSAGAFAYPWLAGRVEATAAYASGERWPRSVEVRVMDVGQGNAVLVRTPEHHAVLFDGGPTGCELAAELRRLGVKKLDLVVISHPHADHFAGLLEAVPSLEVGTLIDQTVVVPAAESDGSARRVDSGSREASQYLELRKTLAAAGAQYAQGVTGAVVEVDNVVVRLFAPARPLSMVDGPDPWSSRPPSGDELNGSSLVALVSIGDIDILIPGDAEADVLATYDLPEAEVLLVPHHGSRGAVATQLLARLQTAVACVSVGAENSYGHPDPQTLALLRQRISRVLRTDESGWVSFTTDGTNLLLKTERGPGD